LKISPAHPPREGEGQPAAAQKPPPGSGGGRLKRERRTAPPGDEWFRTQPWATQALLEREAFPAMIWECACGDGIMARPLLDAGYEVIATDLRQRGYGVGGVDFLATSRLPSGCDSIITNPPYGAGRATAFAQHALALGARKVALLLRTSFLEGDQRERLLFAVQPPCRVWQFAGRVTMWRGDDLAPRDTGGATPFAWFVWERHHRGTQVGWIPQSADPVVLARKGRRGGHASPPPALSGSDQPPLL